MRAAEAVVRSSARLMERGTQEPRARAWEQWLHHPERFRVRQTVFQIHLWVGAVVGLYVVLMSVTGSIIVFRDELSRWFSVEWLVHFHENLLSRHTGRVVNGVGVASRVQIEEQPSPLIWLASSHASS